MTDIDKKMLEVSERLNLMIDKQERIMELHTKYRLALIILTDPSVPCPTQLD